MSRYDGIQTTKLPHEIRYHTRNWQIQQNLSIVTIICVLMGCFYRAAAIG